jgi:hypothetical protein
MILLMIRDRTPTTSTVDRGHGPLTTSGLRDFGEE